MMDAHRWWMTWKNERMGIILDVTHSNDHGFKARDGWKKRWVESGMDEMKGVEEESGQGE